MSLHAVIEQPHFEKTSFRVKKKIFLTYDKNSHQAMVKLTESEQDIFRIASKGSIAPVENKWGKQGWTKVDLKTVDTTLFTEVLKVSFDHVRHDSSVKHHRG